MREGRWNDAGLGGKRIRGGRRGHEEPPTRVPPTGQSGGLRGPIHGAIGGGGIPLLVVSLSLLLPQLS